MKGFMGISRYESYEIRQFSRLELGYLLTPNPDPYVVQTVELLGHSLVL